MKRYLKKLSPLIYIALFFQKFCDWVHIGPFGDGAGHIAVIIKYCQPGAHAIGAGQDIVSVDFMVAKLLHYGITHGGVIHNAKKSRAQLNICDVFHHISGNAAVDVFHPSCVSSGGEIIVKGKALDVYKCCADDQDTHGIPSVSVFVL